MTNRPSRPGPAGTDRKARRSEVRIPAGSVLLEGTLELPDHCSRVVAFAHGSGSSRLSRRNRFVAEEISACGIGTLLFDLLTSDEDEVYRTRFNIDLLTTRLAHATAWLGKCPELEKASLGLFGASTGSAAALKAAAHDAKIRAVVSRGGRPDLAGECLGLLKCPTLLIVGGRDYDVLQLNRVAFEQMTCERKLEIVHGATHLFEEPGALEEVARLAVEWFDRCL